MLMDKIRTSHEKLHCSDIVGEYLERTIMTIKYNYPNIKVPNLMQLYYGFMQCL